MSDGCEQHRAGIRDALPGFLARDVAAGREDAGAVAEEAVSRRRGVARSLEATMPARASPSAGAREATSTALRLEGEPRHGVGDADVLDEHAVEAGPRPRSTSVRQPLVGRDRDEPALRGDRGLEGALDRPARRHPLRAGETTRTAALPVDADLGDAGLEVELGDDTGERRLLRRRRRARRPRSGTPPASARGAGAPTARAPRRRTGRASPRR